MIPLPFTCQHAAYNAGAQDDHGNTVPDWAGFVTRACFWWSVASTEPTAGDTGTDQATVDLALVLDAAIVVDHRDRFTVNDKAFEVIGLPKEWDHGPFGYQPNRQVLELKWVG